MIEKKLFLAFIIFILTFIVWGVVLKQVPAGEGYTYFSPIYVFWPKGGYVSVVAHDNSAKLIFDLAEPIFGTNLFLYMLLEVSLLGGLFVAFYFFVLYISKDGNLSFLATVFFLANYTGLFDMVAAGEYQRFSQRVPIIVFIFVAFYFLISYLRGNGLNNLVFSFLTYFGALLMAQFNSFLMPLFVIFPVVYSFVKKGLSKSLMISFLIAGTYGSITYYFSQLTELEVTENKSVIELITSQGIVKKVFYQIVVASIPGEIVGKIARVFFGTKILYPYTSVVEILLILILIIFAIALFFLYKRNKKESLIIFISFFVAMLGSMFLYIYVDDRLNPLTNIGEERFYFLPAFYLALLWAYTFKTIFGNKRVGLLFTCIIAIIYLSYNTSLIWKDARLNDYKFEPMRRFISYFQTFPDKFDSNSVLVVPSRLTWPMPFIHKYYLPEGAKFIMAYDNWEKDYESKKNQVFVFDYEFNLQATKEPRSADGRLIELTDDYRSGKKIEFTEN